MYKLFAFLYEANRSPGQRRSSLTLVAILIENLRPDITQIPILVRRAEGEAASTKDDLEKLYERVREELLRWHSSTICGSMVDWPTIPI
jgi:hypothetical protein